MHDVYDVPNRPDSLLSFKQEVNSFDKMVRSKIDRFEIFKSMCYFVNAARIIHGIERITLDIWGYCNSANLVGRLIIFAILPAITAVKVISFLHSKNVTRPAVIILHRDIMCIILVGNPFFVSALRTSFLLDFCDCRRFCVRLL